MSHVEAMLNAYPKDLGGVDRAKLTACIQACVECAQMCTACADACLSEDMVAEMAKCIRTDLDCADIWPAGSPPAQENTTAENAVSVAAAREPGSRGRRGRCVPWCRRCRLPRRPCLLTCRPACL